MDLIRLNALENAGGAVRAKFLRLRARADAAAHDSPAAQEFAEFCAAYQADPAGLTARCEGGAGP